VAVHGRIGQTSRGQVHPSGAEKPKGKRATRAPSMECVAFGAFELATAGRPRARPRLRGRSRFQRGEGPDTKRDEQHDSQALLSPDAAPIAERSE